MIKTKIIIIFVLLTIFIFINYRKVEKLSIKQTEYDKYVNSSDTAVDILKPTLTLYYDRRDPNCKYYYDDTLTSKIFNYNIAKKDLQDEDEVKLTELDNDIENFERSNLGVWNQIKTLYYNYENGFPFS